MPTKVLIADDNPSIRIPFEYELSKRGYEVITAVDGPSARLEAREVLPDIVVLDVMMPTSGDEEGFDVCRDLKSDPKTEHIPVIFLTVLHEEKYRQMGHVVGADAYLTKPVGILDLVRTMEEVLRQAQVHPAREATAAKDVWNS